MMGDRSFKVINKGVREESKDGLRVTSSHRRRVMIDGDDIGDESFYIEEIIEESEEESEY